MNKRRLLKDNTLRYRGGVIIQSFNLCKILITFLPIFKWKVSMYDIKNRGKNDILKLPPIIKKS